MIFLSLMLTSLASQTIAESAVLEGIFNEDLHASANTGGARVMGLQVDGKNARAELKTVLPTAWDNKPFCVRTRSSDALYNSENTYRRPNETSQDIAGLGTLQNPIDVPHIDHTEHQDSLMAIGDEGFAVRIFLSACADITDTTESTVALWRDGVLAQNITVLVNSLGAERLVAILTQGDTTADPVDCEPIAADVTVAFDRVCTLQLLKTSGFAKVELLPFKGGKLQRPELLPIRLP